MSDKIKLYIVDFEEMTINRLEEACYRSPHLGLKVIGSAHNFVGCVNDMNRVKEADVVLISAHLTDQKGHDLIEKIKKANPAAKVIIMVTKQTRNLAETAMDKGADDILQKPFKFTTDLLGKIHGVLGREVGEVVPTESTEKKTDTFRLDEYDAPPAPPQHDEWDRVENERKMFTDSMLAGYSFMEGEQRPKVVSVFYSTSSGGKTTLLTNVAAAVQKYSDYRPDICILDLNIQFPSVLNKFKQDDLIMCRKTIFDICADISYLDKELLEQALVTHEPTGIKILHTPNDHFGRIKAEDIEQLIMQVKEYFDLVLIDTSSDIREDATSFPITIADKSVVIVEPDFSSILHTRKFIRAMEQIEKKIQEKLLSKFIYVFNKENPKTGVRLEDVKKALFRKDVPISIPEDINIPFLSNSGSFVVDHPTASERAIVDLANMIYPFKEGRESGGEKGKKKSRFGSWFK